MVLLNFICHCATLLFGFMRYYQWSLLLRVLVICVSPPKLSSLTSDLPFEFKMFEKVLAERKGIKTILEHKLLFLVTWKKQLTTHFSETTSEKGNNTASIWNTGGPNAIVWIGIFFIQCYSPNSILNPVTMHCLFSSSCHCSIWSTPFEKRKKI